MSESKPPESSEASLSPVSVPDSRERPKTIVDVIKEQAPEVLKAIPPEQIKTLEKRVIFEQQVSYRSGMLPEPSELAAYNDILPDGANRIMKMVEAQSAHRISLESTVVASQQSQEKRGQFFGLLIALVFVVCGTYAAMNGHDTFGSILVGGTLVSLVGIFAYSKAQAQKDLSEKRKISMPTPAPAAIRPINQSARKNRRNR